MNRGTKLVNVQVVLDLPVGDRSSVTVPLDLPIGQKLLVNMIAQSFLGDLALLQFGQGLQERSRQALDLGPFHLVWGHIVDVGISGRWRGQTVLDPVET